MAKIIDRIIKILKPKPPNYQFKVGDWVRFTPSFTTFMTVNGMPTVVGRVYRLPTETIGQGYYKINTVSEKLLCAIESNMSLIDEDEVFLGLLSE